MHVAVPQERGLAAVSGLLCPALWALRCPLNEAPGASCFPGLCWGPVRGGLAHGGPPVRRPTRESA